MKKTEIIRCVGIHQEQGKSPGKLYNSCIDTLCYVGILLKKAYEKLRITTLFPRLFAIPALL